MNHPRKPITFKVLCEEHSFSREEYDLFLLRLDEEREFASNDIIRTWKRQFGKPRDALGRWL